MNRNTPLTPELVDPVAQVIHQSTCELAYAGEPCTCARDNGAGRIPATAVLAAYRDDPAVTGVFSQASSIDLLIQGFIEEVIGADPSAPLKTLKQTEQFAADPSLSNGADAVLAIMIDLAQRGHTFVELRTAVIAKARRNLGRTWVRDEQGIFHHDPDTTGATA